MMGRDYLKVDKHIREEHVPPVLLRFTSGCSLAKPSNKWRTDGGRQAMGHSTGWNVNTVSTWTRV